MRESPPSIADVLMDTGALLDGRYRLDALIHRTPTATIHVAMHRNGSTAWLKLPLTMEHAELLTREAGIANTIGSPLVVRDDGTTPDGVPYLVIDPPDAEPLSSLRVRARTGTRLSLPRVMTAGDALARTVAALHAMSYATSGLADENILVFANGDAALLDLQAIVPATPEAMAADVKHLVRLLSALFLELAGAASSAPSSAVIRGALAAGYPNVAALQAGWRAASPEPIQAPSRTTRTGSLADISSARMLAAPSTPLSMKVEEEAPPQTNDSVIGYLRSAPRSIPPPPTKEGPRAPVQDPLSKPAELPRLVQAASVGATRSPHTWSTPALLAAMIGAPLVAFLVFVTVLMSSSSGADRASATAAMEPRATTPTATPAVTPEPVAAAAPEPEAPAPVYVGDDLQLTAVLRSEGAPPDRDVFIDGKPIGKTPLKAVVPCGSHTLQMVAGAPKQTVDLPCGGERIVRYDAKGHWALRAE